MNTGKSGKIVPQQRKGSHTGATSNRIMDTRHEALVLFEEAKRRLLQVNRWRHFSGGGAEFTLTDEHGQVLQNAVPKVGNLIRIELPAPPNSKGHGYDWVRIEEFLSEKDLLKDEESYGFRVRPVKAPGNGDSDSAHFYTSDATSSFVVSRRGSIVIAMERGRNEVPNISGGIFNKIRNAIVAVGAMLGLAKPQWKGLTDGLLSRQQ